MKFWRSRVYQTHKGQSFIELAIVLVPILILLSGVIEFGNLLNQYINVTDAAREGARWGANGGDPFDRTTTPFGINVKYYTDIFKIIGGNEEETGRSISGAMAPIVLYEAKGDDVIISVFSISGAQVTRFPYGANEGVHKFGSKPQSTRLTNAEVQSRLSTFTTAPDTGMVAVEIFYHYDQILKMPFLTAFVPNPILVYTYAFMPVSAAEPTPTPIP
jgi:hypothetical protein